MTSVTHPAVAISQVKSLTYLDYIFNPCSLLQLTVSMNAEGFKKFVLPVGKDLATYMNVYLPGATITGEIVSYSVSRAGADQAPLVSMLLMPPGVARRIAMDKLSFAHLKAPGTVKGANTNASFASTWIGPATFTGTLDPPYTPSLSDSIIGAFMAYRRMFAGARFPNFLTNAESHYHRILYAMFPAVADPKSSSTTLKVPVLLGDYNFSKPDSPSPSNEFSSVVRSTEIQIGYQASSQGLLNSAYTFIPRMVPTLSNMVGHYINETVTMNMAGPPPAKAMKNLLAIGNTWPDSQGNWAATNAFKVTTLDVPVADLMPIWKKDTKVIHLRTQYTYGDDGSGGTTGHNLSMMLGRFNPTLAPQNSGSPL